MKRLQAPSWKNNITMTVWPFWDHLSLEGIIQVSLGLSNPESDLVRQAMQNQ